MTNIPLIEQLLVVSTAHLRDENELDNHPMAYALSDAGGWLLVVADDPAGKRAGYYEGLGDGAKACLEVAQYRGCEFVRFDPNGPVMAGIETYDWVNLENLMSTLEERVNNDQDIIDSRDLIARIEELEGEIAELEEERDELGEERIDRIDEIRGELEIMKADLKALKEFASEAEYSPDFEYGETLIRDSYFTEYAQQLAEDIDAIPRNAGWPMQFVDWEAAADALKQDYRSCEFDGSIYWIRA